MTKNDNGNPLNLFNHVQSVNQSIKHPCIEALSAASTESREFFLSGFHLLQGHVPSEAVGASLSEQLPSTPARCQKVSAKFTATLCDIQRISPFEPKKELVSSAIPRSHPFVGSCCLMASSFRAASCQTWLMLLMLRISQVLEQFCNPHRPIQGEHFFPEWDLSLLTCRSPLSLDSSASAVSNFCMASAIQIMWPSKTRRIGISEQSWHIPQFSMIPMWQWQIAPIVPILTNNAISDSACWSNAFKCQCQ